MNHVLRGSAWCCSVVLSVVGFVSDGWAQVPDSVAARSAIADTVVAVLGFDDDSSPFNSPRVPARLPTPEAAGLLGDLPASFVYRFGTPGWPHGWSYAAFAPHELDVVWNDQPLHDLFSGRSRHDLLPLTTLGPIASTPSRFGAPFALETKSRDYQVGRPVTDVEYWTSNKGLQSIRAVHNQQRKLGSSGTPTLVSVLFGYHGIAATGEYPSSKLRKGRQVYSRMRIQQPRWSVEISELHNRRHVGTHSGVLPPIFRRLEARVENSGSERETRRNDLSAVLNARSIGTSVTSARLSWTRDDNDYQPGTSTGDTLATEVDRVGGFLSQTWKRQSLTVKARAESWRDNLRKASWIPDSAQHSTSYTFAGADISRNGRATFSAATAGIQFDGGGSGRLVANGRLGYKSKVVNASIVVLQTPRRHRLLDEHGYGTSAVTITPEYPETLVRAATATVGFVFGTSEITGLLATSSTTNHLDYFETIASDSIEVRVLESSLTRLTAETSLGLRTRSERGIYLNVRGSLFSYPDSENSELHSRLARSLPEWNLRARVGVRYLLFQGDFDMDLHVRAQYWPEFGSRVLSPQSGLLAVPTESVLVNDSYTVDVVLLVGVRTATLFLSYENLMAGTAALDGNVLVDGYPLAEQRFRFGVYWPIFN